MSWPEAKGGQGEVERVDMKWSHVKCDGMKWTDPSAAANNAGVCQTHEDTHKRIGYAGYTGKKKMHICHGPFEATASTSKFEKPEKSVLEPATRAHEPNGVNSTIIVALSWTGVWQNADVVGASVIVGASVTARKMTVKTNMEMEWRCRWPQGGHNEYGWNLHCG